MSIASLVVDILGMVLAVGFVIGFTLALAWRMLA
jgi:hypothetical protein